VRYFVGTKHYAIAYSRGESGTLDPITYSHPDYVACTDTRRSVTGVVTLMAGGLTFWMSKRQDVGALSMTEAEYYIALAKAAQQASWNHQFLKEVGHPAILPKYMADNRRSAPIPSSIHELHTSAFATITCVRQSRRMTSMSDKYIQSEDNPANVLTKASARTTVHRR
jgi:hypothetical protein